MKTELMLECLTMLNILNAFCLACEPVPDEVQIKVNDLMMELRDTILRGEV